MARAAGTPEGEEGLPAELSSEGAAVVAAPHAPAHRPDVVRRWEPTLVLPLHIRHLLFLLLRFLLLSLTRAKVAGKVAQPWSELWNAAAEAAPAVRTRCPRKGVPAKEARRRLPARVASRAQGTAERATARTLTLA